MPLPGHDRRAEAVCQDRRHTRYLPVVHGILFTSLRDYVGAVGGAGNVDRVFRGEVYLSSGAYDDVSFSALVGRASEELDVRSTTSCSTSASSRPSARSRASTPPFFGTSVCA